MKEQRLPDKSKRWFTLFAAGLAVFLLAGGALLAWRLVGTTGSAEAVGTTVPRSSTAAEFETRYGIQVVMLGVSAGGGLIDMRFRVTDAEKAAMLLDTANRPSLVAEDSGTVLTMHVRPEVQKYETDRVYYLLYANTRSAIQPGTLVSVELGDLRLEHMVAQ